MQHLTVAKGYTGFTGTLSPQTIFEYFKEGGIQWSLGHGPFPLSGSIVTTLSSQILFW